jgi:hypothetical protein
MLRSHAMSEARVRPPSEELLRAARQAGLAPHAPVVGIAAALSGMACLGPWLAGNAWASLQKLAHVQLEDPFALAPALSLLRDALLPCAALPGLVFGLSLTLGRLLHGGPVGGGRGLRVARKRPTSHAASVLAGLGVLGLSLHTAHTLLHGSSTLPAGLRKLLVGVALWLLLCALLEAALARHHLFRALHLSRREHLDEARAMQGDGGMRAARAREAQRMGAGAS